MNIRIVGKNVDTGPNFKQRVNEQLNDVMNKYSIEDVNTSVTLRKDGGNFEASISSHIGKNFDLQSKDNAIDAYTAFARALEKFKHRIQKYKNWSVHHNKKRDVHVESIPYKILDCANPLESNEQELHPVIIANTKKDLPVEFIADAVTKFDLSNANAYVFRNLGNSKINIIYRREDGNIGWIDTDN